MTEKLVFGQMDENGGIRVAFVGTKGTYMIL